MRFIDLTGQRYNRLIVLERVANKEFNGKSKSRTQWLCQCDCGNKVIVTSNSLRNGTTKSCGCYGREVQSKNGSKRRTHGMTGTKLYSIWHGMKKRCNNPTDRAYKDYGGRGIKICNEWNNSFEAFYEWAIKNGYEEGLTIERKNVNKSYTPDNCCWIPKSDQSKNRRNSLRSYNELGEELNIRDIVNGEVLSYSAIESRVRKGWDVERAIRVPKMTNEDRGNAVEQVSLETGEVIREYRSMAEAHRKTGFSLKALNKRCKNGGGEFRGYMWRYKEKLKVKIKYFADIDKVEPSIKGSMVDLRCAEDVVMKKGETKLISLGVAMKLPKGYYAKIYPRSSTFGRYKILMTNGVGVIDSSYCGNNDIWYFSAYAVEDTKIEKNTRICQFVLVEENPKIEPIEVVELEDEDRGGFGSTGEK